jgi:methyl-accepting chemotaxis protein
MSDWSIAKRLKLGLGSLAAIILVLSVIAVSSALLLRAQFAQFRHDVEITRLARAITEDVFEAKLSATRYQRTPTDALAEAVESNIVEVRERKDVLLADAALDAEARASAERMAVAVTGFSDAFQVVRAAQSAREDAFAEVARIGPEVGETLTRLMNAANRAGDAGQTFSAARVMEAVMLGRFYMERFVQSGHLEAFELSQQRLGEADQQLSWISTMPGDQDRADLMATAREQIDAYARASRATQEATVARDGALDRMAEHALSLEEEIDLLTDGLSELMAVEAATIDETFSLTAASVAVAAVLALAYALALSLRTMRRVRRDFDCTLGTVSELTRGNLEVEIEGAGSDTELGRIASALEVFRDKSREAAELQSRAATERAAREEEDRRRTEREREAERARAAAEQQAAEERKREIFDALSRAVSGVVSAAAAGDFSRRVEVTSIDAELHGMAEDINRLMANVDRGLHAISSVTARLADGDLREGMVGEYEGTFRTLQTNIQGMIESLGRIVADISAEADGVRVQSSEMTRGAEDLARRAEAQAASLEQTSAAMTEIASSAESNAASAAETNTAAAAMNAEAHQARQVLEATTTAMTAIEEHSKEIEAIVDVIEDIAFQTNLLSLNASVEAARAGEAGKGFAVVANEVRALAQRSADASAKVQQIITQSTGAISRGSEAVGETGNTLARIVERIESVSSNLSEIKSASEEQATAVKDISNAFGQLDKITQKNASVAEETRAAAGLLSSQAERMQASVGRVRIPSALDTAAPTTDKGAPARHTASAAA